MEASESRSHAPRGGLERAALEALIDEGLTVRQMAARVDRSATTVRYWIRAYGLEFDRRPGRRPREIVGITENGGLIAACPVHGSAEHGIARTVTSRSRWGFKRYRCTSFAALPKHHNPG